MVKWSKIFSLTLMMLFAMNSPTFAAKIFVGEVASYSEHELQDDFLKTFRDVLSETLEDAQEKGKLEMDSYDWVTGSYPSFSGVAGMIQSAKIIPDLHMEVITYGPLFEKATANVKLTHYAENALGRDYFWDDDKIAAKKKLAGKPYRISDKMTQIAKTIGEQTDSDYLLFCNLVDADVELSKSIFNASTTLNERPKKIKVETFFYLIDTKTGLVYEGRNFSDKTGQILNLLGQYGHAMEAKDLLIAMFKVQSKRIVEDVCNVGQKVLAKGI